MRENPAIYYLAHIGDIVAPLKHFIPEMPLLVRTGPHGKPGISRPLCIKPFQNSKVMTYPVEFLIETEYGTNKYIYHLYALPSKKDTVASHNLPSYRKKKR